MKNNETTRSMSVGSFRKRWLVKFCVLLLFHGKYELWLVRLIITIDGGVGVGAEISYIAGGQRRNAENERSEAAIDEVKFGKFIDFDILLTDQIVAILGLVIVERYYGN